MSDRINPFAASDTKASSDSRAPEPSTWRRNLTSLAVIGSAYNLIAMLFALSNRSLPEAIVYPLMAVSVTSAVWANMQIGPRIGWGQGGLPIVFVLVFGWAITHLIVSLTAAGILHSILDPDRLLH